MAIKLNKANIISFTTNKTCVDGFYNLVLITVTFDSVYYEISCLFKSWVGKQK